MGGKVVVLINKFNTQKLFFLGVKMTACIQGIIKGKTKSLISSKKKIFLPIVIGACKKSQYEFHFDQQNLLKELPGFKQKIFIIASYIWLEFC